MDNFNNNIELRVLLLALLKKQDTETYNDILAVMENSKVFTKKTGKKHLKELKELNFLDDNFNLTFIGLQKANEVEKEFTL